jgi:N-acetyl-anhydromuramyl-L-alanine amidase AmpD
MPKVTHFRARAFALFATAIIVCATLGSAASAGSSTLQSAFASAAAEFQVPPSVLLAVSYNLTRWESSVAPNAAGAFGLLQLADVPSAHVAGGKGDDTDRVSGSQLAGPTIAAAATASGASANELRADPKQNIRGGAALLAQYARDTTGALSPDAAKWYGAVAKYSGSDEAPVALGFADSVFATIATGASRTTSDGQAISLAPTAVTPDRGTAQTLALRVRADLRADCPANLDCRFIPAAYQQNSADPGDYGNYDLARRPIDGLDVRFIVIHDAETSYDATIRIFQNPLSYVSTHYVLRSSDGQVTQMVENKNVAWHAGNWNFNMHAIGYEHEGVAIQGTAWYTDAMYRASAALTSYLAARYHVPLDRAHIIGHDDVPGPHTGFVRGMHWDPGPFWDWARYMRLLGAPIDGTGQSNVEQRGSAGQGQDIVTIAPNFETNRPQVRDCEGSGNLVPPQPANFVYLRTAPSFAAPLFNDPGFASPSHTAGTDCANDWGDKAVTGQTFYRAERQGDWDAIYYAGSKVWFHDPDGSSVVDSAGTLITPKAGATSIPVYGRAYPESISTRTMAQYSIPSGQRYVAYEKVKGDYYDAQNFNDLANYRVITTQTEFYLIRFNHRLAYVKASDVDVIGR